MLEVLEDMLKEFQKSNQKIQVRAIGMMSAKAGKSGEKEVQKKGKEEMKIAETSVSKTNNHLRNSIKGNFGKKSHKSIRKTRGRTQRLLN
ncbi:hypothetical protein [Listeria fleischmannii]|uniref:Uncharacterized protein n=1 Tax=Listeria fleischmannii FSL S10-1203 TaxID=1265822 RepID=W7DGA6_9LIST|nr:hypothetical protein [Listeria fleischmannii]EUJ48657.1 hypothetical protein MCOL2_16947 [Listeria fleischmannii FSL S10-1203]